MGVMRSTTRIGGRSAGERRPVIGGDGYTCTFVQSASSRLYPGESHPGESNRASKVSPKYIFSAVMADHVCNQSSPVANVVLVPSWYRTRSSASRPVVVGEGGGDCGGGCGGRRGCGDGCGNEDEVVVISYLHQIKVDAFVRAPTAQNLLC